MVIQKSLREGFGLTVSEALWKKTSEGAATRITQLLGDRRLRERLGENGYQHVKQNFLVTRHVKDYILTMLALEHPGESVVHLG